jgi:hypothetical protein
VYSEIPKIASAVLGEVDAILVMRTEKYSCKVDERGRDEKARK